MAGQHLLRETPTVSLRHQLTQVHPQSRPTYMPTILNKSYLMPPRASEQVESSTDMFKDKRTTNKVVPHMSVRHRGLGLWTMMLVAVRSRRWRRHLAIRGLPRSRVTHRPQRRRVRQSDKHNCFLSGLRWRHGLRGHLASLTNTHTLMPTRVSLTHSHGSSIKQRRQQSTN